MAPPTNVRGVRSFLGAVGYYMKFIPQFAQIARPLVLLTKKNNRFVWGADCQSSFETLKGKLASSSILTFPEPSLPYKLYTDASQYAVGAVLTQDRAEGEKVIQYVSHKLNAGQQKWPTIEREAYAIIHAVKKLRHYLYGSDFTIFTDHKPLKSLFTAEMKNTRVQRWAIQLEEYSPRIEYKPGKLNMVADLMSRLHATGPSSDHTINVIDTERLKDTLPDHLDNERNIQEVDKSEVHKPLLASTNITDLQKEDKFCCQVKKSIEEGTSDHNVQNFVIMDDLLYHISGSVRLDPEPHLQLVIPKAITETILKGYHDESGHLGIDKTYDKIRTRYFWANMYHDVVLHISKCDSCRSRKLKQQRAPMGDMPVAKYPFEIVGIDTCGPYIEAEGGAKYIIVIIDHFSGWPEAYTTHDKSALTVASLLLTDFIPRHSCPKLIISDQGTEFCNALVDSLTTELNINRIRTSPYQPQSNGKTERFNRVMNDIISKYVSPGQRDWDEYLSTALMAYRMSSNASTRHTPFFLVYGRDPVLPMDTLLEPRLKYMGEDYVTIALERLHKAFSAVKLFTSEARERNKAYIGRTATNREFHPGDAVHYLDKRGHPNLTTKLLKSWLPYYRVVDKLSTLNYRIKSQLTGNTKVVHIENLLAAHPDNTWDEVRDNYVPVMKKYKQKLRATRKRKDTVPERQQPMRAARLTLSDAFVPLPEQYVAQPLPRVFKRNETPTLNHDDEDGDDVPTGKTVERESNVHSHAPKPTGKEESDEAAIKTAPSTTVVTPSPIAHGYFLRGRKRHRGSDNESPINADNTPEVPEPVHKRVKTNNLHEDSGAMDVSTLETSSKLSKFYHWVTSTFTDKKVSRGIGMFRMMN